jgi:hypothetical protein
LPGEGQNPNAGGRMQRVGDRWMYVRDPPLVEP